MWCAISRRQIVGSIFFTATVTLDIYRNIITQFISLLEPDEQDCIFQQDEATPHAARPAIEFLCDFFVERLVSAPLWSPRSPDLSVADFFLWEYLKDEVYKMSSATINELE